MNSPRDNLRYFFLIGLMIVCVSGLIACQEATPPPEPVTITFGYTGFENRTAPRQYYQELADQFNEQYPHITVEVGFDELSSLFFGQGIEKDSLVVLQYVFSWLLPQESIIPLDKLIEIDPSFPLDDYIPGVLDFYVFDGITWGIPASVNPYLIYYNKDLFDQKGVPYPDPNWTWDDFLAAAEATRNPDEGIYGYGSTHFFAPDSRYLESLIFIYQHGGTLFDDYKLPTQISYDDPKTIKAIEWYANLYNKYDVAPSEKEALDTFGGNDDNSIYQGIYNGKVAMWGSALSERDGSIWWPVPWPFSVGVLPLPRSEQIFNPAYSTAYVISSQSEHPEETWLWISFLAEQPTLGLFPVRKSIIDSEEWENNEDIEIVKEILDEIEPFPLFVGNEITYQWADYQRALARVINYEEDLQEVLHRVKNR